MADQNPPTTLYKYLCFPTLGDCNKNTQRREWALNAIIKGEFFFSNIKDFKMSKTRTDQLVNSLTPANKKPKKSKSKGSISSDYLNEQNMKRKARLSSFHKKMQENHEQNLSILCLTKSFENLLMWSHYADKHQGICIGLNFNKLRKYCRQSNDRIHGPLEVHYEEKYPKVSADIAPGIGDTFIQPIITKSKDWGYEQEHRMIAIQEARTNKLLEGSVESVYFGAQMTNKNKNLIKQKIKNSKKQIKVFEMERDQTHYKLNHKCLWG